MNAVVRAWLGFLGLGAGLIHLALVIGSPPIIAVPLLVIGIVEFGWGVICFTTPAIPFPRLARIGAVVPILGWVLLLVLSAPGATDATLPGVRVLPMLAASLLDLAIAVAITAVLRRPPDPRPIRSRTYVIALGAGALVVAALTTPALAATEAGDVTQQRDLPNGHSGH